MLHLGPGNIATYRCPRAWSCDPIAFEAWDWYRWWKRGQLGDLGQLPTVVTQAVDILDYSYGIAKRADDDRKEAARKRQFGVGNPGHNFG